MQSCVCSLVFGLKWPATGILTSEGPLEHSDLLPWHLILTSASAAGRAGRLFNQLVDMLRFYLAFPIEPLTGQPLTDDQVTAQQYARVQQLQRLLFKHHPELQELALANCGAVAKRSRLLEALRGLDESLLTKLVCKQLGWADGWPDQG